MDNTVDQATGTVKLKGSFPNSSVQLWPGQFINLRLFVDTLDHAVVVPTAAVQRGPDGAYVYAVQGDVVALTRVTIGRQNDADTVVTAGLAPPSVVVTTGFTRLTDRAKIAVGANPAAVPAGAAAPPEPAPSGGAPRAGEGKADPPGAPQGGATEGNGAGHRRRRDSGGQADRSGAAAQGAAAGRAGSGG